MCLGYRREEMFTPSAKAFLPILVLIVILPQFLLAQEEWHEHNVASEVDGIWDLTAADVDGDGNIDIVGAARYANDVIWWKNLDGSGTTWYQHIIDWTMPAVVDIDAEDIDGDGDIDVVGSSYGPGDIIWWENIDGNGWTWAEHYIELDFAYPKRVTVADMNNDGNNDILSASYFYSDVIWWENSDGEGNDWVDRIVSLDFYNVQIVLPNDIDNDGDLDVIGISHDSIIWAENVNGNGLAWVEHVIATDQNSQLCISVSDIDFDGDIDIVISAGSIDYGFVRWWENLDGTATDWIEHSIDEDFWNPKSIYASDIDGDGDSDVVGADHRRDDIVWWENDDGHGLVWTEHVLTTDFEGASSVYTADIDGDGSEDVIGGAAQADAVKWWRHPNRVLISLIPSFDPITVPAGGSFEYDALISSNLPGPYFIDFWADVILPSSISYGPLWVMDDVPMSRDTVIEFQAISQDVPWNAPIGEYQFKVHAGVHPFIVLGEDQFSFEVVDAALLRDIQPNVDWKATGYQNAFLQLDSSRISETQVPTTYRVSSAYPNPFNPTTSIIVSLSHSEELNVVVYNITGQLVAELANGQFSAGNQALVARLAGHSTPTTTDKYYSIFGADDLRKAVSHLS